MTDTPLNLDGLAPPTDTAPERPARRRGRPPGSKTSADAVSKRVRKPSAPAKKIDIGEKVTGLVIGVGAMTVAYGISKQDPMIQWDGQLIISKAEEVGAALDQLAAEDPRVRRALESMFTGSSWGKVGFTLAGVVIPIAACHGVVPATLAGAFAPAKLLDDSGRPKMPTVADRAEPMPS